jgi:histidine triad (HIT) family protein
MPDFRYFRVVLPAGNEYYRVDDSAPHGTQVRQLVDGLWKPASMPTAKQFLLEYGLWRIEVSATDVPCPMCAVVADEVTRVVVREWPDAIAIKPLPSGLVAGHTLVIPKTHVVDAAEDALIAGMITVRAVELAVALFGSNFQVWINNGPEADQTVFHLHCHIWPRCKRDGLVMPWTVQQTAGAVCIGDERRPGATGSAAETHPMGSAGTDGETPPRDRGDAGCLGPQQTSVGVGVLPRPPAPTEPSAWTSDR